MSLPKPDTSTVTDACTCSDPWQNHPDGFTWGTPADGSVHLIERALSPTEEPR